MSPMVRLPLTTELALLGFLSREPMYGYEIHQRMSDPQGLGQVWQVKQSQLYALLGKLEGEGYLASELQLQEARPPRKMFQLTEAGKKVFQEWLHSPVEHSREVRLDFLVKLYFLREEGAEAVSQLIDRQRLVSQDWLSHQGEPPQTGQQLPAYEWYVRQFRAQQIQAILAWLEQVQQAVGKAGPG